MFVMRKGGVVKMSCLFNRGSCRGCPNCNRRLLQDSRVDPYSNKFKAANLKRGATDFAAITVRPGPDFEVSRIGT